MVNRRRRYSLWVICEYGADGVSARVWCREARGGGAKGEGRALYGRSEVAMKVEAEAKDAPAAIPGTPIASNTESPVSSLDGLLV